MFTSYSLLILAAGIISSNCHPIDPKVVLPITDGFGIVFLGTAFLITTVVALIACSCCKQRRDGFKPKVEEVIYEKEFQNPEVRDVGFSNALSSELAIFPPPGGSPPASSPQPPPVSRLSPPSKPAAFSAIIPSISDWFTDPNANFPRQQLFYQKEIGKGWFGKVVKGEGRGMKVVVRILREDATPEEKGYFLHEARPFRDLRHKNIARLFGRCLENDPFLLLFHFSANGDLKSFLVTNSGSRNAITEQKISLKMMLDVTEGLKFMNENGYIHTDLAARNCLVSSDLTVKIGDYGTSIDKYKNEYYIVGDMAVPIRWCAPETLTVTSTTIQTNQVTEAGNVWSLGVLLWEIAEFGKLPYSDLSDEQVIIQVFGEGKLRLSQPNCSFGQYLHHIMASCWKIEGRATIEQVLSMLVYLKTNPFQDDDFEARWRMLKPNTIAVVDNHTPIHSPRHTLLAQRPQLPAKLEFDSGVDLEIKPTDENPDSCRTSTPITVSPQLSVASEEIFQPTQLRSPSLTNLKGSLEDVTQFDSWLTGVEQKTEEDRTFVKNISEAIKNLDETLALEKTSSSSADSSMEGAKKPLLEFRLGPQEGEKKGDSLSSDTEEETWRKRIERGEFSEKVKEKSKSVTDLMVLTHIESEGSESDSLPSLSRQCSVRKGGVSFTGVGFGSEGNIRNAVLSDELQEKLRQLSLWKTDTDQSFLGIGASETIHSSKTKGSQVRKMYSDTVRKSDPSCKNSDVGSVNNLPVMKENVLEIVNTQSTGTPVGKIESKISVEDNSTKENKIMLESNVCLDSSQSEDNSVPKIVITESELSNNEPLESENDLDAQYFVNIKPRKFVFVCRDLDDDSFVEPPLKNPPSPPVNDNSSPEITISESKLNCTPVKNDSSEKNNSSVILGPCNEHTLDYFKGLKTTFMPMNDMYSHDYVELNDVELMCDIESGITDNLDNKLIGKINNEDSHNYFSGNFNDYPLPDLVPENSNSSCKSSNFSSELENYQINDLLKKSVEQGVESKLFQDKNGTDEYSLLISSSAKDISEDLTQNTEDEDGIFSNDEKQMLKKNNFTSDRTLNSNDSLSTDSPVAGTNILNSCSLNTSDSESSSSEDVNSSEEQLVEAPYPFNQPLIPEHHVKSKSLDSFLLPKNDLERINGLVNGVFYENNLNSSKHYVPVFNMTESVSENAFMNQNAGFDKYFSIDSGHSSDRCMEQDKQMNDLKNRLEDVVKSGSDFQLKNSEEEYGGKLLTPDDERSSDSGFRDKGSLSESVEDTCDEKYNLEDIDAELDDYTSKSINNDEFRYYEQLVNEKDIESNGWFLSVKPESNSKENGWISQSTENEESLSLSIDAEFAAAIRNELKEKLPCAQQNEKSDEDNSPEVEEQELNTDSANQFAYPSQLSPILEEQESNQSSLQLNDSSPTFILLPPDSATSFKDEIIETLETPTLAVIEGSAGGSALIFSDDKNMLDDDVLIVDTETNEATLIESPKPQPHPSFILFQTEDQILFNGESPEANSENFVLTPENAPSTPNSSGTESHSSPENGNMSGFFLSPCSVRSDLFDSGPPSLPFDLGQSLEEVEDLPIHKVASLDNISQKELNFENGVQSPVLESNKCESDMQSPVLESTKFNNSEKYNMNGSCEKTPTQDQEDSCSNNMISKKELFNPCFIVNETVQQKLFPTANYPEEKDLNTCSVMKDSHLKNGIKDSIPLEQKFDDILSPESSDDSKYFSKNMEIKSSTKEFIERESQISPNPSKIDSLDTQSFNDEVLAATHFNNISEKKSSCTSRNHSEKDWSEIVPGKLGVGITSTLALLSPGGEGEGLEGGPLPSPEDGWRPTISQLMELTEADGEEMTTSFIDPDPNGTYTPDWESDISESSSSGEFLWREGDKEDLIKCVASDTNSLLEEMGPIMERIEEEDEDCSSTDSESSSEGSASTEFRPSSWNAYARPLRSILRTPSHQGHNGMKRVVFKKEKYQCVYEYPREDSDSEEEPSWQTPSTSLLDYSVFTDWELGEGEVPTTMESVDSDSDEAKNSNSQIEYDFYRLDYNPTSQNEWRESLPGSDAEFAPLASDLIPVRLGDLKHTKATLRLELPTLRPDQGEASILDSGSNTA